MKNSRKGFTLVELVVVIAIIGVLAAILVPSMLNYVKKSRLKAANANAKTAYHAVSEYVAESAIKGKGLSETLASFATGDTPAGCNCKVKPTDPDNADNILYNALSENGNAAGRVWVLGAGAGTGQVDVFVNGQATFAIQWAQTDNTSEIWGQYPNPISWNTWNKKIKGSAYRPGSYRDYENL